MTPGGDALYPAYAGRAIDHQFPWLKHHCASLFRRTAASYWTAAQMLGFFQKPCSLLLFYHIFSIQCKKKFFSFEKAMGSARRYGIKSKKYPRLFRQWRTGGAGTA